MNDLDGIKLPPHSVEAEQAVIGGLMLAGGDALDRIEGLLSDADFYRQEHRQIFAAICSVGNGGSTIDVITVAEALERAGSLERAGGLPYLGELAQNTPSAANIKRYAEIVKARAILRGAAAAGLDLHASCSSPGADAEEEIAKATATLDQLLDTGADEPSTLADCMTDAIADIDDRATGHRCSGLQTCIAGFDALTGGLEPGQLVIVAARPSVGKTAFALNVADRVSLSGESVAFFSLEMTKRELTQRLLALRAGVSVVDQRSGRLEDGAWGRVMACQAKADGEQLFLIDRSAIGVPYVRAVSRKIKRNQGLSLIVVDYLGLMKGEGQNRTQEIGSLSRGLKALAKELHVPIVALAQLNRGTEGRQDKRPMLSDLRDSGEIEQDADIVAMLHRESIYSDAPEWAGVAELLVRKNRNGSIGEVMLNWRAHDMRFGDYSGPNPRNRKPTQTARRGGFGD